MSNHYKLSKKIFLDSYSIIFSNYKICKNQYKYII